MIETLSSLIRAAGHKLPPVLSMEQRQLADARVGTSLFNLLSTGSSTYTGRPVSPQIALTFPAVYACVSGIAKTVASLPLNTYRMKGANPPTRELATTDYRYRMLLEQPNEEMSSFNWMESVISHLLLWGNHYSYLDMDGAGRIRNIWPLEPQWVQVLRTQQGGKLIYRYFPHNPYSVPVEAGVYLGYQILHIAGLGFDGLMGHSPVALLRQSIANGLAQEEYGGRFFANNARPGFVIEYPNEIKDTGKFREQWDAVAKGLENAHKPALLWGGMKVHEFSQSLADSQFLEGRNFSVADIARIYDYPLHRLGDPGGKAATYASAEQADIDFAKHTIAPWCARIERKVNISVLGSQDSLTCRFDMRELYRADLLTRANARKTDVQGGIISINEGRIDDDRNPIGPDGDKHYMQMQMVPIEQIGETPQPGSAGPVKVPASTLQPTQKVNGKVVQ